MLSLKEQLKKILPSWFLSLYHFFLAWVSAAVYGYPSRRLTIIGVTGTKGKTTVTELISAIFEEAGHKTALINSIRIKISQETEENMMRMSMPGRFFIQKFLHDAVLAQCTVAILEMTSEGARQHRHRYLALDALVFMNLAPEHIESHGSYEAYANAKFAIAQELARSPKRPRIIVANADDKESGRYLTLPVEHALPFSLSAHKPYEANEGGGYFTFEETRIAIKLPGEFSLKNALAAATAGRALGIPLETIARALSRVTGVPGRAERIEKGQDFTVIVDYAHTPDSLTALYETYKSRKICVLGSTGGGRDTWKRPIMGRLADQHCDVVILTDEDPYDEDPRQIVEDVAHGMTKRPEIVMDRHAAISRALEIALSWSKGIAQPLDKTRGDQNGITVLITGKGTNHEICGPKGTVTPWSDAKVVREELETLLKKRAV